MSQPDESEAPGSEPEQPAAATPPQAESEPAAPAPESSAEPAAETPKRKTTRERADERRQEKLDHVAEQIDNGSLTVRRMTEEELRLNPPRPVTPRPGRGRGR